MAFKPIIKKADLPKVGDGLEDFNFDLKAQGAALPHERAKDIAAFANAAGGVILIGAQEDPSTNSLSGWRPITKVEASKIQKEYTEAAKSFCAPLPSFSINVIERVPGEFAVAVNVFPHSMPPVAVRVPSDALVTGKRWDAWVFFIRANNVTKLMSAEEASVLMLPAVRRTMLLLDSIPPRNREGIAIFFFTHQRLPQRKTVHATLLSVEPDQNIAVFSLDVPPGAAPLLHIPLSEIESVWPQQTNFWAIRIRGEIANGKYGWSYLPNVERAHFN